jgi:beta-glucosidase
MRLLFLTTALACSGVALAASVAERKASAFRQATNVCTNGQLNLSTKIGMMHGFGVIDGYSRNSGCGYECGRQTYRWDNGPQGFADGVKLGTATQWPSTINMAATFDADLALEWGTAMGEEFWGKGTNIQEGPGINIARIMRNGRSFEYISGEDPVLGTRLVAPIIEGIQKNVMAIAKHYLQNNQETDRNGVNEVVDEVTMMELYGKPFDAAVQHAAGVMCAYNRINGDWACENKHTLRKMLKGTYNFSGFVVSDWGATHSTSKAIQNGLDIEMPTAKHFTERNIEAALAAENISTTDIDNSCVRILQGWFALPEDKRYPCGGKICIDVNVSTPEHKALARKIAAKSTVLLKNEGNFLPLDLSVTKSKRVVLIGKDAGPNAYTAGQGSGGVTTNAVVYPLAAMQHLFGSDASNIVYEEGKTVVAAVSAAKDADIAIVFGSAKSGEGHDRANLSLDGNSDDVIAAVSRVQKNTIVVMTVPGSVLTPWRGEVPAILTNFFPGEQVGPALGDIIFGVVSPSAKLPVTMPNLENEQRMTMSQYPGVATGDHLTATYSEGQIVGYRWYDKNKVKPAFAFGHGLTYGSFAYSNLEIMGRTVRFSVARTSGLATSCETPQVYFSYPNANNQSSVPTKVLRFFKKVCTEKEDVSFDYTDADVSNWDVQEQAFQVTKGIYGVFVGSSSQAISLTGTFVV